MAIGETICPRCGTAFVARVRPVNPDARGDLMSAPQLRICPACEASGKGSGTLQLIATVVAVVVALAAAALAYKFVRTTVPLPPTQSVPELPVPPAEPPGTVNSRLMPIDPWSFVTNDDYPPSAQREGREGTVGFRVDVSAEGSVISCTVTAPSGQADLDQATCDLIRRRARFRPGRDGNGAAIGGTWSSRVKWQIAQ